jgi:hypothetical protein
MGTRGACGFRIDGNDKITYNHYDSYPAGLGADIIDFIKKTPDSELISIADNIILVEETDTPTPEQIEECKNFADLQVGAQTEANWYCLLREAQGDLSAYKINYKKADINDDMAFDFEPNEKHEAVENGLRYMINSASFLLDSLFCEWAYIINTDTKKLEIYKGFNKEPVEGRYSNSKLPDFTRRDGEVIKTEYYGVILLKEIPLDELRKVEDVQHYCRKLEEEAFPPAMDSEMPTEAMEL